MYSTTDTPTNRGALVPTEHQRTDSHIETDRDEEFVEFLRKQRDRHVDATEASYRPYRIRQRRVAEYIDGNHMVDYDEEIDKFYKVKNADQADVSNRAGDFERAIVAVLVRSKARLIIDPISDKRVTMAAS